LEGVVTASVLFTLGWVTDTKYIWPIRNYLFYISSKAVKENQGAYNSGKPGKLREFVNSGKLRNLKFTQGIYQDACCFFVTI